MANPTTVPTNRQCNATLLPHTITSPRPSISQSILAGELPGGHSFGLQLAKGDSIAFNVGFYDWEVAREYEREEATAYLEGTKKILDGRPGANTL